MEGGGGGGTVVGTGTPEQIAANDRSHTGAFLRDLLNSAAKPGAVAVTAPKTQTRAQLKAAKTTASTSRKSPAKKASARKTAAGKAPAKKKAAARG
mgnify:FL=1